MPIFSSSLPMEKPGVLRSTMKAVRPRMPADLRALAKMMKMSAIPPFGDEAFCAVDDVMVVAVFGGGGGHGPGVGAGSGLGEGEGRQFAAVDDVKVVLFSVRRYPRG